MAVVPMFPLGSALLPGERLPLHIFEPRYQEMLRDCLEMDDPSFGVVLIAQGREAGGGDVRYDVATLAHIVGHRDIGDGRHLIECIGDERIRVDVWLEDDPYPRADVRVWPDEPSGAPAESDLAALELEVMRDKIDELYRLIGKLAAAESTTPPPAPNLDSLPTDPGERLFQLATHVPMGESDRQAVLEAPGPAERLRALLDAIDTASDIVRFRLQG
ncbi:LON peptidase substrate-binding domain-containing protein [Rhodococcoides kyotonense]|uniref:Lon N-terminal domain-containing protein n=1 Tax=Rhodococcoides kyotonense TaxID=398843 RepID=A0A239N716_9NOCA|nr:LON peptidase substrate-binding domain-containing protein [Rhodococcus kyotonensis]SNT49969.1 ATP-dependent Lon protease/hypothetical protein [Rhodococcus kyotonensis]